MAKRKKGDGIPPRVASKSATSRQTYIEGLEESLRAAVNGKQLHDAFHSVCLVAPVLMSFLDMSLFPGGALSKGSRETVAEYVVTTVNFFNREYYARRGQFLSKLRATHSEGRCSWAHIRGGCFAEVVATIVEEVRKFLSPVDCLPGSTMILSETIERLQSRSFPTSRHFVADPLRFAFGSNLNKLADGIRDEASLAARASGTELQRISHIVFPPPVDPSLAIVEKPRISGRKYPLVEQVEQAAVCDLFTNVERLATLIDSTSRAPNEKPTDGKKFLGGRNHKWPDLEAMIIANPKMTYTPLKRQYAASHPGQELPTKDAVKGLRKRLRRDGKIT